MRLPRAASASLLAALAALVAPHPLPAQSIAGTVVDAVSGRPVANALVALVDAESRVRSSTSVSASGGFTLAAPARGMYRLLVTCLGYEDVVTPPLLVATDDVAGVKVELRESVVVVEGVVGYANANRAGFERRSTYRYGTRIGFDEIASRGELSLSQLAARRAPFVDYREGYGFHAFNVRQRPIGTPCVPTLFVDGRAVPPRPGVEPALEEIVDPGRVRAIEVYVQDAVPAPYWPAGRGCAVVAVWTADGFGEM